MIKNVFRKGLVLAIIVCFIGIIISPATGTINLDLKYDGGNIFKSKLNRVFHKNYVPDKKINTDEYKQKNTNYMREGNQKYVVNKIYNNQKRDVQFNNLPQLVDGQQRPILWDYSDDVSVPFVSICDSGNYIWVGQWLNNPRFQLFKTIGSGMPEWEYELPDEYDIWLVDSSAESTVLAGVIFDWRESEPCTLYKWNMLNSVPSWSYNIPDNLWPGRLCVSKDGARIVLAAYNFSQQIVKIFVFEADSNVPSLIYPITTEYCYVYQLDISDDGSIVLVSLNLETIVINITTQEIRWRENESPATISGDGSILVYQSWDYGHFLTVQKWDSIENEYLEQWHKKFTPKDDWFICVNCHTLEVSDDGSTIMVGVDYIDDLQNKVVMFDVDSGNLLWEHYSTGLGEYSNMVFDIRLSYNGSRGIVAYWGDEFNTVPELKVFGRECSIPIFSVDSPGSMESGDISPDGKFAVGGCKMVHANELGCGGIVYAIEVKYIYNTPPNISAKPSGPTSGKIKIEYTYTTNTTDPEGDQVYYIWDWGDGNFSDWLGPFDSGDTVEASHTWEEKGDYSIKVKAKDIYGAESPWSDPLPVTMPKNKVINLFFIRFLENHPNLFPILQRLLLRLGLQ